MTGIPPISLPFWRAFLEAASSHAYDQSLRAISLPFGKGFHRGHGIVCAIVAGAPEISLPFWKDFY